MKIVRVLHHEIPQYGILSGDKVEIIEGNPFEKIQITENIPFHKNNLLPPTVPTKIIAIGLNYTDHIHEMKMKPPEEPLIFLKAPSALNGPNQPIVLPKLSQQVDFEGELAVVMGKKCRNVKPVEAEKYIFGYSCFNDVTARDLQRKDIQFTRAKSFDTFACLGPWVETELDPSHLKIETKVNGKSRQSSNTEHLLFKIPDLISFISEVMTLLPGDIISTGTPSGVGPLKSGDNVEVFVEGIGTLANPIQ